MFAGKDKYEFSARMKMLHDELSQVNENGNWNGDVMFPKPGQDIEARRNTADTYRKNVPI